MKLLMNLPSNVSRGTCEESFKEIETLLILETEPPIHCDFTEREL